MIQLDGPRSGPSFWGSASSSFRRRSPYPLLWVDPLDLILLLIPVPRVETRGYKMGSILRISVCSCSSEDHRAREAHKPAKPTNSWGASRTMIQLDGPRSGPSFWGSASSSFRRRSPYPLLWVDPLDLILLLIPVPRVETRGYKMGSILRISVSRNYTPSFLIWNC